jgi:ADP-ribose pyrophosphatase YjhB (NUDIX family)
MTTIQPLAQWLLWARRIQAISQTGLTYAQDPFDRERYEELSRIAAEIVGRLSTLPEAVARECFAEQSGYATPKIDVRAAIFRDGRILLVRERSDGFWTLPGGWADPGASPSECAVKEVLEESGYQVRAKRVLAILDRDRHGHPPLLFAVYKMFFECELLATAPLAFNSETDAVDFFAEDELPPLSLTRIMPHQVARLFELHRHPEWPPDFD